MIKKVIQKKIPAPQYNEISTFYRSYNTFTFYVPTIFIISMGIYGLYDAFLSKKNPKDSNINTLQSTTLKTESMLENTEGVVTSKVTIDMTPNEVDNMLKEALELAQKLEKRDQYQIDTNHPFYKKRVVFTGTLASASRAEAIQLVRDIGGIVTNTLSRSTNFLVVGYQDEYKLKGYNTSNKEALAVALNSVDANIEIIKENEFWEMIGY